MKIPKNIKWQSTGKTLGSGGQAQVHLVSDKSEGDSSLYALKALKRTAPGQAYERFYREISAVKFLLLSISYMASGNRCQNIK